MADNRTPRELETRASVEKRRWTPASTLPEPSPDPDYTFRWIATAIAGIHDPANTSKKFREGWEPVKLQDHPELGLVGTNKDGNVEIGGLMLCKMPNYMVQQRTEHFNNAAAEQLRAVDSQFKNVEDPRMPLYSEKSTEVKFGKGK